MRREVGNDCRKTLLGKLCLNLLGYSLPCASLVWCVPFITEVQKITFIGWCRTRPSSGEFLPSIQSNPTLHECEAIPLCCHCRLLYQSLPIFLVGSLRGSQGLFLHHSALLRGWVTLWHCWNSLLFEAPLFFTFQVKVFTIVDLINLVQDGF